MQEDALNYLKEKGARMLERFNHEMQTLCLHFQDYRQQTDAAIKTNSELWVRVTEAEKALALEAPLREAQYGLNERTPLTLFNPLIPKMKEHLLKCHPNQMREYMG